MSGLVQVSGLSAHTGVETSWLGVYIDCSRVLQVVLLLGVSRWVGQATDSRAFPVFWELAFHTHAPACLRGEAGPGPGNQLVWFGSLLPGSQGRMETQGRRRREGVGRGTRGGGGRVSGDRDEEGELEGKRIALEVME